MQSIYQKIISSIDNNFVSCNKIKLSNINVLKKGGYTDIYNYISTLKIKNKKFNFYKNKYKKIKKYYKNFFPTDD